MAEVQKIRTFLWYDGDAEEAANFYVSLFEDSEVLDVARYDDGAGGEKVSIVNFRLAGQEFMALNGGPQFKFTEAVSLFVNCDSQEEVDRLWGALTANGGEESMCGWLKDRYGLSWQIVPVELMALMGDPNPAKAQAVTQAMLQMRKIEVPKLREAHSAA